MEWWNNGGKGTEGLKIHFFHFDDPIFQYSIIPFFHAFDEL